MFGCSNGGSSSSEPAETHTLSTSSTSSSSSQSSEGPSSGENPPPVSDPVLIKIEIESEGKVLRELGSTHTFYAKAFNTLGEELRPTLTWQTSNSEVIHLDEASGLVTALKHGSATVYAESEGVRSNPVLVVVSQYQPEVDVIAPQHVLVGPQLVTGVDEPAVYEPGIEFEVELDATAGIPEVGGLIAQDEENPFVGRVVSVEETSAGNLRVILAVPTVPEVFSNLLIDEEFKLQNPNIEFEESLSDYFETAVNVDGSVTLTPKVEQISALATPMRPGYFNYASKAQAFNLSAAPVGTFANPFHPFLCSFSPEKDLSAIPIRLDLGSNAINITTDFSVPFIYKDTLEKLAVRGEAKAEFKFKASLTAAVEGKFTCKLAVGQFSIPMPGLLGFLISTNLKYGIGGDMGLKVKVADIGFEQKSTAELKAEYGYYNPPECQNSPPISGGGGEGEGIDSEATGGEFQPVGNDPVFSANCGFKGEVESKSSSNFVVDNTYPEFTLDEILQDLTIEPTISGFGYTEVTVGNPLFKKLSLSLLEIRAGATLAGNFAVPTAQIVNASYKSDYKSTLDILAKPGSDVDKALSFFKIVSVGKPQIKFSFPRATSPAASGPLFVENTNGKEAYLEGDQLNFHVLLDETKVNFLPTVYNVDEIQVYKKVAGSAPQLITQMEAEDEQLDFNMSWTADSTGAISDEFFAFVTTDLFPVPFIDGLELGKFVPNNALIVDSLEADINIHCFTADDFFAPADYACSVDDRDQRGSIGELSLAANSSGASHQATSKIYNEGQDETAKGVFEFHFDHTAPYIETETRLDPITAISDEGLIITGYAEIYYNPIGIDHMGNTSLRFSAPKDVTCDIEQNLDSIMVGNFNFVISSSQGTVLQRAYSRSGLVNYIWNGEDPMPSSITFEAGENYTISTHFVSSHSTPDGGYTGPVAFSFKMTCEKPFR